MLNVNSINTYYGNVHALKDISLKINRGSLISIIGANGAGKSTFLKTIIGLLHPKTGKIEFKQKDITNLSAHQIVKCGVSLVPEGRQLFGPLSVVDNLRLGTYKFTKRERKKKFETNIQKIYKLFPVLEERLHQKAKTLSGGEQQMVTIGRSLMSDPELLLLDEPSLGLAPLFVKDVFDTLKKLKQQGLTIVLVEQNAKMALRISDYVFVLDTGKIILDGPPVKLANNDKLKEAYLGGK